MASPAGGPGADAGRSDVAMGAGTPARASKRDTLALTLVLLGYRIAYETRGADAPPSSPG